MLKEEISNWFRSLQDRICKKLEDCDGEGRFREDTWEREGGGGGRSRVMEKGVVIEKGGVNFSAVHGSLPEAIQRSFGSGPGTFFATGVSIVIHPVHPFVPVIHMNVRYFETSPGDPGETSRAWFGGGIDLTPHYIDPEEAAFFHRSLKETCNRFHPDYYPRFKAWADDYFYIPHRNETRGIGGIFFDRLGKEEGFTLQDRWRFVKAVGNAFTNIYLPLIERNRYREYTEQNRSWQLVRRGRYVEFNLVYDAGTKFGLETSGRIESILMSLPPLAGWEYDFTPEPGSPEQQTQELLKKGIDWI